MLKSAVAVSLGLVVVASAADAAVRTPLVEYFTNVQCPPCASFANTRTAWEDAHVNECSFVHYHMSWPGYDPFYASNTADNHARRVAYNVQWVPWIQIDTIYVTTNSTAGLNAAFNAAMAVPCFTEISFNSGMYGGNIDTGYMAGQLSLDVTTEAGYAATDARLFVAAVERDCDWNGTGSYDHHDYVLRKFISDSSGDPIDLAANDSGTYAYSYRIDPPSAGPVPKPQDFMIAAWIQNGVSDTIEQSMMIPFTDMVVVAAEEVPTAVVAGIGPNHPNPFNPTTSIPIAMEETGQALVQIFDATGALVRTLSNGVLPGGTTNLRWDGTTDAGTDAPSGVYFVRLESANLNDSRAITLLK